MYEKLYTSKEVSIIEGVTIQIAQRFAVKNNVRRVGKYYFWNKEELKAFKNRKKARGPILGSKRGTKDVQE